MSGLRLLVLGGGGMLGRAVASEATSRGWTFAAPGRSELDLVDTPAVERVLERERPEIVVNCAAFTKVDLCEEQEELATEINGHAVGRAAAAAASCGLRFVQVSTDYVFDGRAREPYLESAERAPLQAYGRGKLVGEVGTAAAGGLVVRTSWLFGPDGPNFVETMLKLGAERSELDVVDDQVGCPTYTPALAAGLLDLAEGPAWELPPAERMAHYCNPEPVSWNGFARAIFEAAGLTVEVRPVPTSAFPRPAERPHYSVLSLEGTQKLLGRELPSWRDGLANYLEQRT